jgi:hypothetical protein
MHRLLTGIILAALVATPTAAHADFKTANRQTPLNNVTDFFATVGKSERDKKDIKQERRTIRRDVRLKEEARRKRLEARKRMKQQQDAIMRKVNAQ